MTDMPTPKKLAIIDGKSVYYRGYYAMPNLATKDGKPTGGVYGFAVLALELIKKLKPDYVCIAWDKPKTNIRKRREIYPDYKGGRKPAPADFYEQIPTLHELLDAFGWPLYELDDYEADDIMGALSAQASSQGIETMLITSDLDLLQVIDQNTSVYALKKGFSNIDRYHPEAFEQKYDIRVDQFLDLKSLKGDSSDNIPGAPGIGEKTAVKLLQDYQTLDNIYQHIDEIKASTQKKLIDGKELVYMSKKLAHIWTDAPIALNLAEMDGSRIKPNRVIDIFDELEFRALARQAHDILDLTGATRQSEIHAKAFDGTIVNINKDTGLDTIKIIGDKVFVHAIVADALGRNITSLACVDASNTVYIFDENILQNEQLLQKWLLKITSKKQLAGYNIKPFIKACFRRDITPNELFDIQVAAFLNNSLEPDISLNGLAENYIGWRGIDLNQVDYQQANEIAGDLMTVISELSNHFEDKLSAVPVLKKLAYEIEMPLIRLLSKMELAGIKTDPKYLSKLEDELTEMLQDIEQEIYGHADKEFNIASPRQLAEVLFEDLALPTFGVKKGKTGYSTAAGELSKLRLAHPIIDLISQYREISKLLSTYIKTLPNQIADDGRIHTTYSLTVAQTGRLSSLHPNLQNIPIKTDLGNKVRRAFTADSGKVLISADYSQFELRIAAVLSGDKETIELFNNGIDVHAATAAQMYGRDQEDVTKTMRRDAKVINFGVLYGMSPHGLSEATGMTIVMAKEYIDKYFQIRGPLLSYLESLKKQALEQGFVETLYGRRRYAPDVKSSNFIVRSAAERAAMNMPIQGTASDIMKIAMLKIDQKLSADTNAQILLQIHDSVVVEAPEQEAERVAKIIKDAMQGAVELAINIDVDTSTAQNWADL